MTKFYRQGASGPEELVLVPAEGMSTDAQVHEAWKAMKPYGFDVPSAVIRAALAAAQAAWAEDWHLTMKERDSFLAQGFAAGIEAAAKAMEGWRYHAERIRTLRPLAAPTESEVMPNETTGFSEPECDDKTSPLPARRLAGAPSEWRGRVEDDVLATIEEWSKDGKLTLTLGDMEALAKEISECIPSS